MITAVFDTNIYFQAAIGKGGPAYECWQLVLTGDVRVYITRQILIEIEGVFRRSKLRREFPVLTDVWTDELLLNYRTNAQLVEIVDELFKLKRDPDDELFVNLALTAKASYLVSRDRDLLDLRFDSEFTTLYPSLNIVDPIEFLQAVRVK